MAEAAEDTQPAEAPLDEVMLAMDVVDTLRHREHMIAREMGQEVGEQDLLERLKKIYAGQGIDVPETILKEGVEALKRDRFVYTAPPASLQVAMARAWVTRWTWGRWVGAAVLALAVVWAGYTFGYRLAAERRAEAARIELSQTIPAELDQLAATVASEAQVDEARTQAEAMRTRGKSAAGEGDRASALAAVRGLEALRDTLRRVYQVRIVSRPDERSGVWRIPDVNLNARNYYLIVEAVDADGRTLTLPVRSEETGKVAEVARWGQRVPQEVFEQVRRDKEGNGIIENAVIGEKRRGYLEPDYSVPVEPGAITSW